MGARERPRVRAPRAAHVVQECLRLLRQRCERHGHTQGKQVLGVWMGLKVEFGFGPFTNTTPEDPVKACVL